MIKALIFDWHGVLDRQTFRGMMQAMADKSGEDVRNVMEMANVTGMQYGKGTISEEDFWNSFETLGQEAIEAGINYSKQTDINQELWETISDLAKHYDLFILSDCSIARERVILENHDLSIFKKNYFSCDYQLSKKEDEFFTLVSDEQQLQPHECIFVDDSDKNVMRAEVLGFYTIHLTPTTDVLAEVEKITEEALDNSDPKTFDDLYD